MQMVIAALGVAAAEIVKWYSGRSCAIVVVDVALNGPSVEFVGVE